MCARAGNQEKESEEGYWPKQANSERSDRGKTWRNRVGIADTEKR